MNTIREDIYQEEHIYSRLKDAIEKNAEVLAEDKKLILDFDKTCSAKGLSIPRKMLYLKHLRILSKLKGKSFGQMDRQDMEGVMASIMNNKRYSDWTKETFKIVLKVFYRWLYKKESSDSLPDVVKWIQGTRPPNKLNKDELITKEELQKIMDSTGNIMYKALLSVLYEGALRPGELLQMRMRDVIFEDSIARIKVTGKMKRKLGEREVYLAQSVDMLKSWMNCHPFKEQAGYPLWIVMKKSLTKENETYGKPVSLRLLTKNIGYLANKAGIKKRIYPYLFRHSAATQYYAELGEALAKKFLGHSLDSKMSRVYCHLNEQDVLDAFKRSRGIEKKEEKQDTDRCHRCGHVNGYGAKICMCGAPLNMRGALEQKAKAEEEKARFDRLVKFAGILERSPRIMKILEDPEFQKEQAELLAGNPAR
ncbi:MAG: site-specific integrase [archaeon]